MIIRETNPAIKDLVDANDGYCPCAVIQNEDRWLCFLPWKALEAVRASSASNASNADALGGYSYGQLFTSDFNQQPIAAGAHALRGFADGNVVEVHASQVLDLLTRVSNLEQKVTSLEVLVKGQA